MPFIAVCNSVLAWLDVRKRLAFLVFVWESGTVAFTVDRTVRDIILNSSILDQLLEETRMWKAWSIPACKRSFVKQKVFNCTRSAKETVERLWKPSYGYYEFATSSGKFKQGLGRIAHKPLIGAGAVCKSFWGVELRHRKRNTSGRAGSTVPVAIDGRGFATQGGIDTEDEEKFTSDSDENLVESRFLDGFSSDEDLADEELGQEKQPISTPTSTKDSGDLEAKDGGEEDSYCDVRNISAASDPLITPGSLLDVATDDIAKDPSDQKRPLWLRLQEAEVKKSKSFKDVMNDWAGEGNPISRDVIVFTITVLRRRSKYKRALEVSDWVMMEKPFDLTEMDYAIRLELIAKVHGVQKAVPYFATIPRPFQTAMAYSVLLTAYVEHNMERSASKLVQKVEALGLGHQTSFYNQLLILYKKNGLMNAVADILRAMDEKTIEPDVYTYNIILDIRARRGDVAGMEKVWKRVKNDAKVMPNAATYYILAKCYLNADMHDKAEAAIKKLETSSFRRKRPVNQMLLRHYAQLGKADEVERIWDSINSGPNVCMDDYLIMIESLGKVGKTERAEEIFEQMMSKVGTKNLHQYNSLLSVYANQGMIQKAEDLMKEISKTSLSPGPSTYHQLIEMYAKAGKDKKAMETLHSVEKATQMSRQSKPWYASYQALLEMFAEKGDVQGAEKLLKNLKDAGYSCTYKSYCALLKAYTNAKVTPYGFIDRLCSDRLIPNPHIRSEVRKLNGT